ncbi:sensor histidine kinase [Ramlibacter humi]|uniref:histidine kinase n=1 Tax=Ramlibacter humi TaxID=2530451 RepID=A0A4Z0CDP6_9BURK|nr:ATP-binding protein [Ramlibacter humi]TFZ08349.1 HAMP domain-containing protein [Ramlibacter humi]
MVAADTRWAGRPQLLALALAAGYLAVGLLWILFSDRAGEALFNSPAALTRFQTWKGSAFVALSALFVYAAALITVNGGAEMPLRPDSGRGFPVAALLSMLVLATALPLVALLGWLVERETDDQLQDSERLVRTVARNTASDAAGFLRARARIASILADRPTVRRLHTSSCDPLLDQVPDLDGVVQEATTFRLDGSVVCGRAARTPQVVPDWRERLARPGTYVSGIARDALNHDWNFLVVHAVVDDQGRLAGGLELMLANTTLTFALDSPLPEGSAVALMDARGTLIARQPAMRGDVGTPVEGVVRRAYRARVEQTFVTRGMDGVERLYALHPVEETGWIAAAGVPLDLLYAPARRTFVRSMLVGTGILLLCGLMVLRLARAITSPVRALRRAADAVAAGDFSRRAPESGPAELAALGEGFNRMLDRLPQLQQALLASEQRRTTMVEKLSRNVPDMVFVFVLPREGPPRLPFASEAIRRLLELEPGQVMHDATPALDRIHWLDRERIDRLWTDSARQLSDVEMEFRVLLPHAGLRHLLARANAEAGEDGAICWYGSLTDVTELRASRQALSDLNDSLEQRIAERTTALAVANEALESFSYSVAHDLRAPLGSIGGFARAAAEALQRGEQDRARGYLERVAANTERMDVLIEGFLALAKVGRERLVESPVDVGRLLEESVTELSPPPGVRLSLAAMPRVLADQALLRQVWANLLSNAFKYSANEAAPRVDVSFDGSGAELVFSVSDNGVGFDPEYAARLFTPFSRLHKAEEFEGTGVGLALVRRIVERHGGRIWAESKPGEGAVFSFSLPRDRLIPEGA